MEVTVDVEQLVGQSKDIHNVSHVLIIIIDKNINLLIVHIIF